MQVALPSLADVAQAIELWQTQDARLALLIARYGDPAAALRHFGLILWEEGQMQAASQVLSGAVVLAPDDPRVWNDLSSVFDGLAQRAEAAACAEASLARDPGQALTWSRLGSIRGGLDDGPAGIAAFEAALALDSNLVDAWVGLGLAHLQSKRFPDSITALTEAIARGRADDPAVQACLGEASYAVGDFVGAAGAFAIACRHLPDNDVLAFKRARAQFAVDAITGPARDAVIAFESLGLPKTDVAKAVHDAFHLLSAHDHREAAIHLGEDRLARDPEDVTQAYLLAVLKGEPSERAPDSYIVRFFDRFADNFDQQLVEVLNYRVPQGLAALVKALDGPLPQVLDIGCGTGLIGPLIAEPGRVLTGVDLSPRMLDKARLLGCYDILAEAEIVAFLTAGAIRYDLVVAADVLIYFGDLGPLFEGVAQALTPGGHWALSIETTEAGDMIQLPSGRFAHALDYIAREALRTGFAIQTTVPTTIRLEAGKPALGALMMLVRT